MHPEIKNRDVTCPGGLSGEALCEDGPVAD
jgi:hypothetical protein